jgi:hypothetical protein
VVDTTFRAVEYMYGFRILAGNFTRFGHEHTYTMLQQLLSLCGTPGQEGFSLCQVIDTLYPNELQTGALLNPSNCIF